MVNPAVPAAIKRVFHPIYVLFENKYYMDWFNENVLARGARALGTGLWKGGDQAIIEGGVVNGFLEVGGLGVLCDTSIAIGLPLPLCLGHDLGRVLADDLVRLAQIRRIKNGFIEPCHLDANFLWRRVAGLWP